jgi:hypothetical protein
MNTLAPKLVLTPLLVGSASLAERRWGPVASGLLVGLPLTSGPIAFFIAIEQGPALALAASSGALVGAIGQAAFVAAYARAAGRLGPAWATLIGALAFGITGLLVPAAPTTWLFVAGLAAIALSFATLPSGVAISSRLLTPPGWDIPARVAIATVLVVGITALAPAIGGRWSGILATFPVYALILATFAHPMFGPQRAIAVLRGLLLGLLGFEAFFLTLTQLLPHGLGMAFAGSVAAVAVVQAALFLAIRSRR